MDLVLSIIVWFTGACFMTLTFPVTLLVWLISLPFDRNRVLVHYLLVYESRILSSMIPVWKLYISGREKALKGTTYVIISNHQSVLDILLLNCLGYKFKWVSKIENLRVPFIGWYLKIADYITVDRDKEQSKIEMLSKSIGFLSAGISVIMFPEGTRSADREIGIFKRGAFQLAIQQKVPILPVVIDGTGGILPKHGLIFRRHHKIYISVLNPVVPEDFGTDIPEILAQKLHDVMSAELVNIRKEEVRL